MKSFNKLALAAAIGVASMGANASDLVFDFAGTVDLTFDETHSEQVIADYTALFGEDPAFATFYGTLVLPDYDQYMTGTHEFTISAEEGGLELSLTSGLLGGLEGARVAVTSPNPDYVEGVENCSGRAARRAGGCDFDGDGEIETPYNNNPEFLSFGRTAIPDDTQMGDYGVLTLVDGDVTSFEWYASYTGEIVSGFNDRLFNRQGWLTELGNISISFEGATGATQLGEDVYFASNQGGVAAVTMVPEAETYAMFLAGMGIVGAIARRRTAKKA